MSDATPEQYQPDQDSEYGLSIKAMDLYDDSTKRYRDACGEYADHPTESNFMIVSEVAQIHADSFMAAVKTMAIETPLEELAEVSGNFLHQESQKRVDFLNALLGKEVLKNFDLQKGPIGQWPEEEQAAARESIIKSIDTLLERVISEDTSRFLDLVEDSDAAKRLERNQNLRYHALDVGKMALVAGIAIAASNLFKRKKD